MKITYEWIRCFDCNIPIQVATEADGQALGYETCCERCIAIHRAEEAQALDDAW